MEGLMESLLAILAGVFNCIGAATALLEQVSWPLIAAILYTIINVWALWALLSVWYVSLKEWKSHREKTE